MGASLSNQLLWLHAHEQTKFHAEMTNLIASVYECRLCMTLTWSDLNRTVYNLYGLRAACHWWLVRSFNLSRLRYSCQCCTLAVAQHCPSPTYTHAFRKYLNAHLKFTVYGCKQTSTLQTHFRNAVPLVWGSLRLTPSTVLTIYYIPTFCRSSW